MGRRRRWIGAVLGTFTLVCGLCAAQAPGKYEPTLESLDRHPLPEWYADAKLESLFTGDFIRCRDGRRCRIPTTIFRRPTTSKTLPMPSGTSTRCAWTGRRRRPIIAPIMARITTTTILCLSSIARPRSGSRTNGRRSFAKPAHVTWCLPASTMKDSHSGPARFPIQRCRRTGNMRRGTWWAS